MEDKFKYASRVFNDKVWYHAEAGTSLSAVPWSNSLCGVILLSNWFSSSGSRGIILGSLILYITSKAKILIRILMPAISTKSAQKGIWKW